MEFYNQAFQKKGKVIMEAIKLWDDAPGYVEGSEIPTLEYYKAEECRADGTVIICPGGGYGRRAPHEGEGYAKFLNSIGMNCFVLEYRVAPNRFPIPLLDARRAIRYVRANAEKFGIDPGKIAIMGSSAGGHLAATAATYTLPIAGEGKDEIDKVDFLPNAQILCYPVTDYESHNGSYINLLGQSLAGVDKLNPIRNVTPKTPPAFIWHTETDALVKVESTLKYVAALHTQNVRCELHVYPEGYHGLGLAEKFPSVARWSGDLAFWLKHIGFIQ